MTSIIIALAVVALVVYGLERNHRRQLPLGSRLAGSSDAEDRDLPRVAAELHVTAADPAQADRAPRRPVAPVRKVHPIRSV
ncbi:hypothetical protein AB0G02_14170 [Actinosynnema sp. NPDC023658]|uniref:hypothetical protein n=1 Tax=Actinosynnema sp. NPDC023658 TaxID=3155465 RepID=UPI0033CEE1AD